ncbi:MAG: hypothetical protein Ct9H300mP15_24360 [Gemmatimonadota bacterium]|nr:MAG: hypothetical protein Ct9H300mP15_24360 [Gemmatimonadota bacterium]
MDQRRTESHGPRYHHGSGFNKPGEAIGTEAIRYGQRVQILVLRAPEIQTTPKGLEHVGPRAFGYDLDFESVFAEAEGT